MTRSKGPLGGGLHHTMAALKLQQFQYNVKENSIAFGKAPQRETTNCWQEAFLGVGTGDGRNFKTFGWPLAGCYPPPP